MNPIQSTNVNLCCENTENVKKDPAKAVSCNAAYEKPTSKGFEIATDALTIYPETYLEDPKYPIIIFSPEEQRGYAPYMNYHTFDAESPITFIEESPDSMEWDVDFMGLFLVTFAFAAFFF
ncbi:hypothetical protein TNIN_7851 [Trichonephila inaurata madagascariensis]|uniref:Uncharacterized protein n=1 Tax=Trichonephila inaurata madagascariensis TaxID=2747483 RepID=A0A8X6Y776_9ARAC|nr:hypothetical protein TNIN_7851 [Trichonephila inaurata madagascariensis]